MNHRDWLAQTTRGDSERKIGRRSGVPFRTINNQANRGRISAVNVIRIAVAYGVHPVRALADTGYLAPEHAVEVDPDTALHLASAEALAAEVLRRMRSPEARPPATTPIDELHTRNGKG